jgi:hypothetical protein
MLLLEGFGRKKAQKLSVRVGGKLPRAYRRLVNFIRHEIFVTFCG